MSTAPGKGARNQDGKKGCDCARYFEPAAMTKVLWVAVTCAMKQQISKEERSQMVIVEAILVTPITTSDELEKVLPSPELSRSPVRVACTVSHTKWRSPSPAKSRNASYLRAFLYAVPAGGDSRKAHECTRSLINLDVGCPASDLSVDETVGFSTFTLTDNWLRTDITIPKTRPSCVQCSALSLSQPCREVRRPNGERDGWRVERLSAPGNLSVGQTK
jgi:hypothetical protein